MTRKPDPAFEDLPEDDEDEFSDYLCSYENDEDDYEDNTISDYGMDEDGNFFHKRHNGHILFPDPYQELIDEEEKEEPDYD